MVERNELTVTSASPALATYSATPIHSALAARRPAFAAPSTSIITTAGRGEVIPTPYRSGAGRRATSAPGRAGRACRASTAEIAPVRIGSHGFEPANEDVRGAAARDEGARSA